MADFPVVDDELYFAQCTEISRSLFNEAGQMAYRPDTREYFKVSDNIQGDKTMSEPAPRASTTWSATGVASLRFQGSALGTPHCAALREPVTVFNVNGIWLLVAVFDTNSI